VVEDIDVFYRVDYVVACICVGLVLGVSVGNRLRAFGAEWTARVFYRTVACLVILTLIATAGSNVGHSAWYWTWMSGVAGGLNNVCLGAIWGIAARQRSLFVLQEQAILDALRMQVAFTFAAAAVGKAFSLAAMTEFFAQSGYSVSFLKFIMLAEGLGAVALLVRWTFVAALIGLAIDMCGAVATHVHNGDPLNDSTGAINMLLRLAVIGFLLVIAPVPQNTTSYRSNRTGRLIAFCISGFVSVAIALVGAAYLHR